MIIDTDGDYGDEQSVVLCVVLLCTEVTMHWF